MDIIETPEYHLINRWYGTRIANRSQVPLMNHIREGLVILDAIGANISAKKAYCLHPLVQGHQDLEANWLTVSRTCSGDAILLAMEYRNIANSFLSDKIPGHEQIILSPLRDVNQMLIADKVQNKKDFVKYHQGKHPRSHELTVYFDLWLDALDVSAQMYQHLCKLIDV